MASTRGTRIAGKIKERIVRQKAKYPNVNTNLKVTKESAISLIQPLFRSRVNQFDFDFAINVLEQVSYDEPTAFSVAKAIANNICIGIDNDVNIKSNVSDKINETCRKILTDALTEAGVCERIITNQEILNKRFDVDKLVRENQYRGIGYIVSELCKMIDTYEMPMTAKFSVALENVPYILAKNNIEIDSDAIVADAITEYFLMRDASISDTDYRAMKSMLSESTTLDINPSNTTKLLTHVLFNNSGTYYLDKMMDIFSKTKNSYLESFVYKLSSIVTESDALDYMNQVASIIKENSMIEEDEAKLYYSINNIPKISNISKDFIELEKPKFFNLDRLDNLDDPNMVISNHRSNQKDDYSIFDKTCPVLESKDEDDAHDIKDLIAKYKAEQEKSPSMIKRFIEKLHTKSPGSIINETPSILTFVRTGLLLCLAASSEIGLIVSAVGGLFSWLLARSLNDKQASNLLKYIKDEEDKIEEKIKNTSDEDKKKDLKKYQEELEKAEKNTKRYLDSIVDTDDDDELGDDAVGGDDDLDFGFDEDEDFGLDFESALITTNNILADSLNVMDSKLEMKNMDLSKLIQVCAENYMLHDLSEIIKASSVPIKKYKAALNNAYASDQGIIEATAIRFEQDHISDDEIKIHPFNKLCAEVTANDIIRQAQYAVLNESSPLTTLKLALHKGRDIMKNLSTKSKAMWQTLDAHASTLYNSVEKALTSDRREALVKGNIIPSFSKCCKTAILLAGVGVVASPFTAAITALGMFASSSALNFREKQLIMDEIDTELKVVEKQIDVAQNDGDMNQYRFLLNYQKKLTREMQRIRYGMKVSGRNIPSAVGPGVKSDD